MRLSEHFTLAEMTVSQTAARLGLDNEPPPEAVEELRRLVATVLQPLRFRLGRPITVLSGYRSPAVNKAVGGAKASQHMLGQAADIVVSGMAPLDVCRALVAWHLPFHQCIHEFERWTHVSVAPVGEVPRREQLTARKVSGKTVYERGLR